MSDVKRSQKAVSAKVIRPAFLLSVAEVDLSMATRTWDTPTLPPCYYQSPSPQVPSRFLFRFSLFLRLLFHHRLDLFLKVFELHRQFVIVGD